MKLKLSTGLGAPGKSSPVVTSLINWDDKPRVKYS